MVKVLVRTATVCAAATVERDTRLNLFWGGDAIC